MGLTASEIQKDRELVLSAARRYFVEHRDDGEGPILLIKDLYDLVCASERGVLEELLLRVRALTGGAEVTSAFKVARGSRWAIVRFPPEALDGDPEKWAQVLANDAREALEPGDVIDLSALPLPLQTEEICRLASEARCAVRIRAEKLAFAGSGYDGTGLFVRGIDWDFAS